MRRHDRPPDPPAPGRRAPTARLLALALAALPASPRPPPSVTGGQPRPRRQAHGRCGRRLRRGRRAPACAASRLGLLYNKAVALHALLDAGGPDALACRAAEAYRQVIALEPESRVGRASVEGARVVEPRCVAAAPPPDPPPPGAPARRFAAAPDHRLEWGLTASAAAALEQAACSSRSRSTPSRPRRRRSTRARRRASSAAEAAALDDFDAAAERTDALGLSGYIVGGVGVALAIGAVASWWIDDAPASTARVGPSGLGIGGVW
ncbi:MAG: hypothetical protein H6703_13165 [Myxococcales bacterium]|nr:hypothetical protein [Myxococcales bacterium]